MNLANYLKFIFDTIKNIAVGLFATAFIILLLYGVYQLLNFLINSNPLFLIIPFTLYFFYWTGKAIRDMKNNE